MSIKHDTRDLTKKQTVDHKRSLSYSFKYADRGIIQVFGKFLLNGHGYPQLLSPIIQMVNSGVAELSCLRR